MDFNEFKLDLQAVLEKAKSIANIKRDIKIIETKLPKIKLQGTLNSTSTKKELNTKLKSVNPKVKIDADTTLAEKKMKKLNQQKTNTTITPTVDNSQIVLGLKEAQKETKTLWERFTSGIFGINLIRMGIQEVTRAIRQAIVNVKELDAIKTNIQMVSGASDSGVNAMMGDYNSMAKDLSSTTKDVAEAANEFLRMGESVASTNELIRSSQVLSKVGMIESAESASYLISSLKGYKIAAENSMDVVSKLTSVDLEAAVSAGGLAEALSKCSNIANNSGVTMDRLIGYTATVGETTQKSMSEVGNSFQALLSRMNNIKIGRFIDDETGESLSDTEAVLNKLGIQLRDTEDSYRSFDAVLDDVGSRWREFNKVQQNAISVAIAGTRQRENFEALMNNYGNALKYAETAANSAGSALERYGVYQDSIQAKTNELTAAIESLSTNVISENLYSGIIEATTGVVEFIDKTNLLKGTLAGLVTMGVAKTIASIGAEFVTAAKSTAQLTAAMALFDNGRGVANLQSIGMACKGLSEKQLKLILSTKGLNTQQRLAILEGMGLEKQERQQTLATLGFAAAEDKATASTFSLKGAFSSLKSVIATNPIGTIATVVSTAVMAFSAYKQHQEEVRQATEEAADAYKESASSIEDYTSRYEELHKALIAAKGNEEETYKIKQQLLDLQTELNDTFGDEYGKLNLVTDAYKDQTEAIKEYNKEAANTYLNENQKGIENAAKEITGKRHYNLGSANDLDNNDKWISVKDIALKYQDKGIDIVSSEYNGSLSIQLTADAQSAYEIINEFESDLRSKAKELGDEHIFDDILAVSSSELNNAKETLDKYGEIYKQALMADLVSSDDKSDIYNDAIDAVEKYNEAVLKSEDPFSDEKVKNARRSLKSVQDEIKNDDSWQKYGSIIDKVFEQADTRLYDFNEDLKTDSSLQEYINGLTGLDNVDLKSLNPGENESFDRLRESADEYGVSIDELIDSLVRLGYVQGKIQGTSLADEAPALTFDQAWADSFTSENDKVKELGDTLLELAEKGRLTKEIFEEADSTAGDYFKNLGVSADEAVAKINKLVDESNQLSSMASQISSMAEALGTKQENGFVSADTLSGFDVEVRGLDSWDRFQEVLGSTTSSYGECQEAANALATEWVNSSDFLAQLTEQNEEYYKTQLESMGIKNYEEVISYAHALNEAKEVLTQSSLELGNATQDEIEALIAEGQYSELTANMILALYDAKIAEQAATIDTSADCENLIALAGDTDRTSQSIQLLIQLMNIYSGLESGAYNGNRLLREEALGEVNRIKKELESLANGETKGMKIEPTVKLGSKGKSSAKKAGKDAGKSFKDALKEELSDLESVISGVTGRIDDQISSVNEQKSAALDSIDAQKEALEEAKDSAVEALEAERDARLEVIETQKEQLEEEIKLIEKQIKSKQDEIDRINKAAEARAREISLQEKEYALEQKRNQRTKLVYTESSGMVYRPDEQGIRKAKEEVDDAKRQIEIANIQKEIDLLEDQKDLLNEQIDLLDEQADAVNKYYDEQIKQTEKYYDSLIKNLEKQRKETEAYYESLTQSLEQRKDKFQELTEILEKAELSAKLKQLGIDEEALFNGSEEEFNKLKDAYMNIVFQLNEGNDEVLNKLRELSGYEGTAPTMLEESNTKLGTMNDELGTANTEVGNVNSSLDKTAFTTSDVATNVSDVNTNIGEATGLINEEKGAFDDLKQTIDLIVEAINQKIQAIETGQSTVASAVGSEMANFQLLINKILEVKEKLDEVNNTVTTMDRQPIDNLTNAFQLLYDKLLLVSNLLGVGVEGEGAVNGISGAIQALNEISLEEGIIAQFTNLKTAIDSVTAAISGGGGESSEGEGSGGGSGSSGGKQGNAGGKGSQGKSGGGNSLTGAIESMGETAKKVIGEPDAEGDGTVIGEFGSMETAVNDVRDAIGTEGSEGQGGGSGGETDDTLVGSIEYLGDKTDEEMGESGGDGIIGRFEEFRDVIGEADEHVKSISDGLNNIDGKEVSCTIKINIIRTESGGGGGDSAAGESELLGSMNLNSATYNAKYKGNAHYEGTAKLTGDWGVKEGGRTLCGEMGQEIVVRGSKFFTVGDNGAEFVNLQKGDLVFNHLQTKELLSKGNIVGRGRALASGTALANGTSNNVDDSIWTTLADGTKVRPLQPGDDGYWMIEAGEKFIQMWKDSGEEFISNAVFEGQKQLEKWTNEITNNSAISNVVNNNRNQPVTVNQNVTLNCPNLTNNSGVEYVQKELGHLSQMAYQAPLRDY